MADLQTGELARYGRWLKRSVGAAFRIGIGNAAGKLLWADGNAAEPLVRSLAICLAQPRDSKVGMRRLPIDDATPIYVCPVVLPENAGEIGRAHV